jgi:hypothetical protein
MAILRGTPTEMLGSCDDGSSREVDTLAHQISANSPLLAPSDGWRCIVGDGC